MTAASPARSMDADVSDDPMRRAGPEDSTHGDAGDDSMRRGRRRRVRGRDREDVSEVSQPGIPMQPEGNGRDTTVAPSGPVMPPAELEAAAVKLTQEFFDRMGFEATVTAKAEDDRVDVKALVPDGEDQLAGRKGEVRQALQHLLNRMLNRGSTSVYHLQLEINNFWEKREAELEDLARRLAEEAMTRQTEIVTEYLNAQERRIVHVTLKTDERVKTYALGTGLIKRVAVAPADFPEPADGEE